MMNKNVALLMAIAGLVLTASATPNPICMKLPDVKQFSGNESCCELPALLEQKVIKECWEEVSATTDSFVVKDCKSTECLFKRHKFLNADGSLDKATADKYLDEKLQGQEEWLKVMKSVVGQCLESVETGYDKMMQFFQANQMKFAKPEECDMKPTLLSVCVTSKLFAQCPETSWNQSPSCAEWKNYMTTCTDGVENSLEFYKQLDKRH